MKSYAGVAFSAGLLMASSVVGVQAASLEQVFNGDMLNTNLRYFESVAGVARETWGDRNIYRVEGCRVEAQVANERVVSLSTEVSPQCQPSLASFLHDYAPDDSRPLTFGNFVDNTGELHFYADCLALCGNAFDPSVYAYWEGPRAAGFINLRLGVVMVGDSAIEAAQRWAEIMRSERGENYVVDRGFACERAFDQQAARLFHDIEVTQITIGPWLEGPDCG